jgi:hypothetical protein
LLTLHPGGGRRRLQQVGVLVLVLVLVVLVLMVP